MSLTDAEKLEEIRKYTGMSWKTIAEKIGAKNAQVFTDIRGGRHGISPRVAHGLLSAFPQIRREWLLLGDGPMTGSASSGTIALFDRPDNLRQESADRIDVGSCFTNPDIALRNTSESMAEYPVGAILVLRRVTDHNMVIPGNNYLIETDEFATVKRVQKGTTPSSISLYSSNTATYPDGRLVYEPFEIPLESINRIFSVLGYVYPQSSEITTI